MQSKIEITVSTKCWKLITMQSCYHVVVVHAFVNIKVKSRIHCGYCNHTCESNNAVIQCSPPL